MPYVSNNYRNAADAPVGQWCSTRTSRMPSSTTLPTGDAIRYPDFCGQCVSFVTRVCPTIPVGTGFWKQGALVRGDTDIVAGTAIATFPNGEYSGHAAIYENQTAAGINVYDQWVFGVGKAIGPRLIRFNGAGIANDGDGFYVVELDPTGHAAEHAARKAHRLPHRG